MPSSLLPPWFDGTILFALVSLGAILTLWWVYHDASSRNINNPGIWAVGIAFLFMFYALPGIAALIIYVMLRTTLEDGPDQTEGR